MKCPFLSFNCDASGNVTCVISCPDLLIECPDCKLLRKCLFFKLKNEVTDVPVRHAEQDLWRCEKCGRS